ncbi:putative regulator of cell autolysis [Bernardetia litoralis DSM 6794]|uniref:Putative regulator of cell autolysis n=1 Tax=Bernardetia litoralis (strain ATCC 23117 / DSM 6794 / NBRC 15988 / NCIMB 1366 / Fx l1 / Sio-4) TaxID=880071 RepID=I4AGZ9_BERLS|nr:histidine kinase [Bernardetia litoralis]AFM03234.1 putative regulator of cell autolysis [Bernardetia litoralis DSM 6794]
MKKVICLLVFSFITSLVAAQNKNISIEKIDKENNSLEYLIHKDEKKMFDLSKELLNVSKAKKYIKGQVWALFGQSVYYEHKHEYQKVIQLIDNAIYLAEVDTIKGNKTKLYYLKGTTLSRLGKIDSALLMLEIAQKYLKYTEQERKKDLEYRIQNVIGRSYERTGEMDKAMDSYIKSIQVAEKNSNLVFLGEGLFNLGFVYESQNNLIKAQETYKQALEVSIKAKDTTYMIYNNVYVGGIYVKQEKYKEGIVYLLKALQLAQNQQNEEGLGFVYFELATYYSKENNLEKAIYYLRESRKIDQKVNNIEGVIASYVQIANSYLEFNKYNLALQESIEGIEIAKEANALLYVKDFYLLISQIAEGQKDFKKAYNYHIKYKNMQDSIFNQQTVSQINELQTKYETEKKEQQIKELEQQKTITDLENKNQVAALQAQVSILGLILLAPISLLVGGGWYVNRRHLYLKLEAEQKERAKQMSELKALRSQMNPHFIFNALNSIQDFIMLSEKENAQHYLGKFATLMRGFLDSSSKSKISLDKELSLLKSYIELEGLRLGDEFDYEIIFDDKIDEDELDEIEIPPLLLQPYLENAFKHGLLHKKGNKKLTLDFSKIEKLDKKYFQLKIIDNGIGREKSAEINARKAKTHTSFATQATTERLELLKNQSINNQNIEAKINDLKDNQGNPKGTEILILIPINQH